MENTVIWFLAQDKMWIKETGLLINLRLFIILVIETRGTEEPF
jgi:hypothetical protein